MGNSSSRSVAEIGISSKIRQANSVRQDAVCESSQANTASVEVSGLTCEGGGLHIVQSGITSGNVASCDLSSNLLSLNNQKADQKVEQELKQKAEAVTKGLNLFNFSDAETDANTQLSAEINIENTVSQRCRSSTLQLNKAAININNSHVGGTCEITQSDIDFSNKANSLATCGLQSSSTQEAIQDLKQKVTQESTAKSEGIDLWALGFCLLCAAVLAFVIAAMGPAAVIGTGIGLVWSITKAILKLLIPVAIVVILILMISDLYAEGIEIKKSPMELVDYDIPFLIRVILTIFYISIGDWLKGNAETKYYKKLDPKIIKDGKDITNQNDNKGLFIINYSSVQYINRDEVVTGANIDQAKLRELLVKKGLQNKELYPDDMYKTSAVAEENAVFNSSSQNNPKPEDAINFMETDPKGKTYYAFEIIRYGVEKSGDILKLDKPITLFYNKLDEKLWNYDSLKTDICLEKPTDTDVPSKITSCDIETKGKKCNKDDDCNQENEFCGMGNVGCVDCKYCTANTDGYGVRDDSVQETDKGCLFTCEDAHGKEPPVSRSLKDKLNDCRICKGKVLQQSEIMVEGKNQTGDNPWNKPNYSNYINSDIFNPENYEGNVKYDSQFQLYTKGGWENIGLNEIGYSSSPPTAPPLDYDDASDDNFLHFGGGSGEEKCLLQKIIVPTTCDSTSCDVSVDPNKYELEKNADGAWEAKAADSSLHAEGLTCYNIGGDRCIDKYEAMCNNFKSMQVGDEAERGATCDTGEYINTFKTLENDPTCGSLSMASVVGAGEWDGCKNACCTSTLTDKDTTFPDQVVCTHVPANTVRVKKRYLPHRSNLVGIREFRDFSDMGLYISPKDKIETIYDIFMGIMITVVALLVVWVVFHIYIYGVQILGGRSSIEVRTGTGEMLTPQQFAAKSKAAAGLG